MLRHHRRSRACTSIVTFRLRLSSIYDGGDLVRVDFGTKAVLLPAGSGWINLRTGQAHPRTNRHPSAALRLLVERGLPPIHIACPRRTSIVPKNIILLRDVNCETSAWHIGLRRECLSELSDCPHPVRQDLIFGRIKSPSRAQILTLSRVSPPTRLLH